MTDKMYVHPGLAFNLQFKARYLGGTYMADMVNDALCIENRRQIDTELKVTDVSINK